MILVYKCPSCDTRARTTHSDVIVCCGVQMVLTETYLDMENYNYYQQLKGGWNK